MKSVTEDGTDGAVPEFFTPNFEEAGASFVLGEGFNGTALLDSDLQVAANEEV